LIEIGSKTAEKNSAQTNKQTDKQTDTTKIMVTWPWTKKRRCSEGTVRSWHPWSQSRCWQGVYGGKDCERGI